MSEHTQHTTGNGQARTAPPPAHTEAEAPKVQLTSPPYIDREFKFSFKKQTVKDELGMEVKRPPVTLNVPIPTFEGLIDELEDPKVQAFVLDLIEEAVKDQVRTAISDEEKPVNRQEDLDVTKLTLKYIANIPKSERTGGGISKETWTEWEQNYTQVMGPIRGEDKAAKAAKLFVGRFNQVRTDKAVLKFLREQLAKWATETTVLDDYQDVYQYLDARATDLINKDNPSQLESL